MNGENGRSKVPQIISSSIFFLHLSFSTILEPYMMNGENGRSQNIAIQNFRRAVQKLASRFPTPSISLCTGCQPSPSINPVNKLQN
mmetsp:Transcript_9971/g.19005  ORF Transcript_9971/g.19005 Transcript_9971/m.19005 type:complete len:86 (+) Transcript_9971:512-769(+)